MSLPPLYSRRKRQRLGELPDVFQCEHIPHTVRMQIVQRIMATLEFATSAYDREKTYARAVLIMREELGQARLSDGYQAEGEYISFLLTTPNTEDFLDGLEVLYSVFERAFTSFEGKEAIARVNARFLEAGIGFALEDGQIVEKSNEFAHQELTRPALHVLSEARFSNANQEFRDGLDAYRNEEYEDCLVDCLKAFESVMKVIIAENGWTISDNATAKVLIAKLFEEDFVPSYMQSQFTGLRTMLEASVPTTRNKSAGHGKGKVDRTVGPELAALQIHQTAALIIFLAALE